MKKTLLLTLFISGCFSMVKAQQLAFPGAEGFGKYAVGGRYGSVYHVTNLKDSGTGSLRDAVSQPNRIIVFDVAGVIHLQSGLVFKNNLYIAGQTAPGEGITVYGDRVSFSGASNTICRYMRFRMGVNGSSGKDACGVANGTNMIFDHVSVSWGQDETFSISSDGKGDLGNITIQNSIMSQGLLTHSAGGLMQADNITLYRNLYVDNSTRNNKIKGKNQYVNNIVYNWQNGCYIMGGDSEGTSYAIAEGNLFINGPSGGGNAFGGGNADYHIYAADNWQDKNKDGVLNPYEIPQNEYSGGPTFHTERFDYPELPLWKSSELIEKSLPSVGASLPYRDYADWYVVNEVISLGKKGGLIARETSLPFGAPSGWNLWNGTKKVDADNDGMPDAWEMANGTDPSKNDAMVIATNGYANIENYINSITIDDRETYLRKQLCVQLDAYTQNSLSFSWLNYTEGETGVIVEVKKGTTFEEVARLASDADSYTIEGLEPETTYVVRLRAFDDNGNYSDYSDEFSMMTKPTPVDMIDIATYSPDYTWSVVNGVWDFTNTNWGDIYTDNSKVLFNSMDDVEVTLNETVSPASVVVDGDMQTIISGSGAIGGTASVNKDGEGVLVLNTINTYKGQTVLHGGTIEFNSLANGEVPSAIGASKVSAQNWIWDGGVWNYTGGSVSTNRQALTYEQTEFNISNKATVTMNGHIEGSGGLTLNGNGQMKVNTTDFFQYAGPTILKGSTLYLNSTEITKVGIGKSSKLIMAGGALVTKGDNNTDETYTFPIEVQDGTYSIFAPHRRCVIRNKVKGSGTLQIDIPYVAEFFEGDWSGFTGRLVANGVNSNNSEKSTLIIQKGKNPFGNVVVDLKGNAALTGWDTNGNYTIGGLSGDAGASVRGSSKQTKGFTCTWTVGGANTDETFQGVINNLPARGNSAYSGTVSIIKKGSGDWRLTGNNVYSGTTMITGGRLIINGTHSGKGAVSVYKGATLAGRGTVNGKVTVKNGGIVAAGDTVVNSAHILNLKGGLTVENGGSVTIPVKVSEGGVATVCKMNVTGAMAIDGATLNLEIESGCENVKPGTVFYLFNMSNVTNVSGGGFTAISPANPGEGLEWDASKLLSTGRLYVKEASSVDYALSDKASVWPLMVQNDLNISLPTSAQVMVYNLAGEMMKSVALQQGISTIAMADLSKGLYLVKVGDKVFRVVKI